MASPFFFVDKKDGKLRPVQDYRRLNDITVKNAAPLPLIRTSLTSCIRPHSPARHPLGYNNIHIRHGDEWKAALKTPLVYLNHSS